MGVALVTPFKKDKSIDYDSLGRLIEYLINNDTDYIVALGTTAETPTLLHSEKTELMRFIAKKVNGRIPLVVGMGGNNTSAVVEELKSTDLSGYNAILSVVPYYNKPSQEGMYQHFVTIARESPLPIVLYNIPGRTGVNMSADTTLRLARDCHNIIGIKEASGNLDQVKAIIDEKPSDFLVISGDDSLALSFIKKGACGVISVIGNALPKEYSRMIHLALSANYIRAGFIDQQLSELYRHLFAEGNPAGIKSMLESMKLIENQLRLPLMPVSQATSDKIKNALKEIV